MNKHLLLTLVALLSVGLLWAAKPVKKKAGKKTPAKKEVKKDTKKEAKGKKDVKENPFGSDVVEVDSLFYLLDDEKETAVVTVPADASYYVGMKEIPEVIKFKRNLYSVTGIGDNAFEGCTALSGVKFPATVVSIGDRAFKGCTKLKTLSLPSDLISVGDEAFMN